MDRVIAEKLMAIYHRLGEPLIEAVALIGTIPDVDEQRRLRRPLGEMMSAVWFELMRPLVQAYLELDPDKDHSRGHP